MCVCWREGYNSAAEQRNAADLLCRRRSPWRITWCYRGNRHVGLMAIYVNCWLPWVGWPCQRTPDNRACFYGDQELKLDQGGDYCRHTGFKTTWHQLWLVEKWEGKEILDPFFIYYELIWFGWKYHGNEKINNLIHIPSWCLLPESQSVCDNSPQYSITHSDSVAGGISRQRNYKEATMTG